MSNLGGGGGAGLGGLTSMIPTIDTGKSRRMAGRPSTGTAKGANNEETPTLLKNPSTKNYGGSIADDVTSNFNRMGSGGADRGSNSKPTNSGLFGAQSNSPTRDPAGLK